MTVSTKLEPQLDKIILGKHQYHSSHHARIVQTQRSVINVFFK